MADTDPGATSSELSPGLRRMVDLIERTAREQVAALSREEALDVLDLARERLLYLANEHGGMTIGSVPESSGDAPGR